MPGSNLLLFLLRQLCFDRRHWLTASSLAKPGNHELQHKARARPSCKPSDLGWLAGYAGMSTNILTIWYKKILLIIRPPVNAFNEALIGRLVDVLDKAAATGCICMLHIRSDQKVFSPELDDFTAIQRLVFRVSDFLNTSVAKHSL
jgi:hypothetical protein